MSEPEKSASPRMILTEEEMKARKERNWAIATALFVMVVIFFVVTLVQLGGNVANRTF